MLSEINTLIIIVVGILALNILSSEEEECSGLKRKFLKIFHFNFNIYLLSQYLSHIHYHIFLIFCHFLLFFYN